MVRFEGQLVHEEEGGKAICVRLRQNLTRLRLSFDSRCKPSCSSQRQGECPPKSEELPSPKLTNGGLFKVFDKSDTKNLFTV